MAKMGKLTPEELARNKMLMRERDRDRKRLKRMNPEYRKAEQERDRDRKKARRANETFRQLEKLRDKIRKERKKGNIVDEAALTAELVNSLPPPTVPVVEPEVIISDGMAPRDANATTTTPGQQQNQQQTQNQQSQPQQQQQQPQQSQQQQSPLQNNTNRNNNNTNSTSNNNNSNNNNINAGVIGNPHNAALHHFNMASNIANINNNIRATNLSLTHLALTSAASANAGNSNNNTSSSNASNTTNHHSNPLLQPPLGPAAAHTAMPQLNKGLLYPPPSFAHHPLPIPGVTLMPQLCHPILHQNLSATLYPPNGIKQELPPPVTSSPNGMSDGATSNTVQSGIGSSSTASRANQQASSSDEPDMPLIEPEIILQTSTDIIASPHHFHNHAAAAAHTHHLHQQQCNMFQHMANQQTHHMRGLPLPGGQQPSAAHVQHQQQQLQQHYAAIKYQSK